MIISKLHNLENKQSGLTLVETLVAITVLLVGVLGPLSIAAQGIGDGIFARNQLAANYLAQEALEVVVNKRYEIARQCQYSSAPECTDDFFNLDSDIAGCLSLGPNDYCAVDPLIPALLSSPSCEEDNDYAACRLVFDTGDGVYRPVADLSAEENRLGPVFTRKLRLELVSSNELRAIVTVDWFNKDVPRSLTLITHLFSQG